MIQASVRKGIAVRGLVGVTTLAVTTLLATTPSSVAAEPSDEAAGQRVLQSVSVAMSPDGTLTGVNGSVVKTTGSVDDAEVSESAYGPDEVVQDLPVRVLTAYRTAEGAGTDLAELQGYTGRIAIDLTVQNLTVKPQIISYDVDGTSRSQAALVGSPLTVTASAALGDLAPAKVVTDDEGGGANVTNGVLGQTTDGGTTVQWATMLAPPTLASSAELSLVVDAKSFDVPEIDLSVQPGLVTDPSIGALVDSAFNPGASNEMELQQRTIALIGDVNKVMARASGTISDVRSNLTSSAETLGTQTVADLQSSTESVTTSMRYLDGALTGLQQDLSAALESTGSSALAELDSAVSAVDQMLGDTSAQPPNVEVKGEGCDTAVAEPRQAESVYGSLLQVAGQLEGYSQATTECKRALETTILTTIGPETPSDEACLGAISVTCSLFGAQSTFIGIADDLNDLTDYAITLLDPKHYETAITELRNVESTVTKIEGHTTLIEQGRLGLVSSMKAAVDVSLPQAQAEIAQVKLGIDAIRERATGMAADLQSMKLQNQAAVQEVCEFVAAGTLTPEQANEILAYLAPTSCLGGPALVIPDKDGDEKPDFPAAMATRLDEQIGDINQVIADSNTAGEAASQAADTVEATRTELEARLDEKFPDDKTLRELVFELQALFGVLKGHSAELGTAIAELTKDATELTAIQTTIDTAVAEAKTEIAEQIGAETREVYDAGVGAKDELGSMLVRSSAGLSNAAGDVVRNGRKTLEGQKKAFAQTQAEAGNRISGEIEDGLAMISSGVSSSTRDMAAASTLLTADLRKVLLDLGDRRVGGGGLLGAMATNAATARTADYQLALASDATTSYANVRSRDIGGILLRQAQTDAAMQMLADLPPFELELDSGSLHRTVYSFRIGDGS